MDVTVQVVPTSYEHGKVTAAAEVVDLQVAEQVNIFIMSCKTGVGLKIGNTTASAMSNVTYFSYQGAKTDFLYLILEQKIFLLHLQQQAYNIIKK